MTDALSFLSNSSGKYLRYGTEPRQTIKKYHIPSLPNGKDGQHRIFIFIHGGAWRDPNNTCNDSDAFVSHLGELASQAEHKSAGSTSKSSNKEADTAVENFFSVDYRLSPHNKFPSFVIDVALAILQIKSYICEKTSQLAAEPKISVSLLGHSVGATLILQYLDLSNILLAWWNEKSKLDGIMAAQKTLTDTVKTLNFVKNDSQSIANGVTGIEAFVKELQERANNANQLFSLEKVFLLDGIYNIGELVSEYASYESFVLDAHEAEQQYIKSTFFDFLSIISSFVHHHESTVVIVQSTRDELLSRKQTDGVVEKFGAAAGKEHGLVKVVIEDFGAHNDVYESREVAKIVLESL